MASRNYKHSSVVWCEVCFDILKRLNVDYECDRETVFIIASVALHYMLRAKELQKIVVKTFHKIFVFETVIYAKIDNNKFSYKVPSSCSCSLYVVVRPSVVCLSVTFVHPTQPIEIFGNVSAPFNTFVT